MKLGSLILVGCLANFSSFASAIEPIKPIVRCIPPPGIDQSYSHVDLSFKLLDMRSRIRGLKHRLSNDIAGDVAARFATYAPDVEVFLKAAEFAVRLGEFYNRTELSRVDEMMKVAEKRLDHLYAFKTPWTTQRGLVVRGYRSSIDGSVQPYGLEIPEDLDLSKSVPLYVWLHGRGDKTTDLHFIHQRMTRPGRIQPKDAIVLHPFGRHCMGFKSAGEVDVLESIAHVSTQYKIDPDRIVLMGFSMGGAGVWHIGAHYADRFVAMSPGAGFAETARYNRMTKENYPPWYVQKLWGSYDVPGYVRNLFNLPVVAYSGELDKQIQAARVMEEAFVEHDNKLPHIIGPGVGHKYHPDSLKELMGRMDVAVQEGLDRAPKKISLQTRTLRYSKMHWIVAHGLNEHWKDARIDAEVKSNGAVHITTKNVNAFAVLPPYLPNSGNVVVDGQSLAVPVAGPHRSETILARSDDGWEWMKIGDYHESVLRKIPGRQGPIDDAFMEPFLVVKPGKSKNQRLQQWIDFEFQHFVDRWQALYRGDVRQKSADEVTREDIQQYHLILWGDPSCNPIIQRLADRLPMDWNEKELKIAGKSYDASIHLPLMIYPNPEQPWHYVVINSGPTHREGHDRTNSLQNPKLPDWAVIDIRQPPDEFTPGKVVAADFFDEMWQVRKSKR